MADGKDHEERLGLSVLWSPNFDAYAEGRIDASAIRCALCTHAPCDCPPFGTPEYLALVAERHGKTGRAAR